MFFFISKLSFFQGDFSLIIEAIHTRRNESKYFHKFYIINFSLDNYISRRMLKVQEFTFFCRIN